MTFLRLCRRAARGVENAERAQKGLDATAVRGRIVLQEEEDGEDGMMKDYSPFTPGVPVPPELFEGRKEQLQRMGEIIGKSVAHKALERMFVVGERGIGKSSLCQTALKAAEINNKVLGVHVYLGGVRSLSDMVQKIFERLLQATRGAGWFDRIKEFLGNKVRQIDIFGVSLELDLSAAELSEAVSNFPAVLSKLVDRIQPERQGLVIVLDDINGIVETDDFPNWFKSMVDEAATAGLPMPATLILAGLPERRSELLRKQPSLDRVFDVIAITRFDDEERADFFRRALGSIKVEIDGPALKTLCHFSGGLPVFMHEIGDAALSVDKDGRIDRQDARLAIVKAATVIGEKYIEPEVIEVVRSNRYLSILKKAAKVPWEHRFSKDDLRRRLSTDEIKVLDNFLHKMKDLGVIQSCADMGRGGYEFTREIYPVFLSLWAGPMQNR